MNPTIPTFDMHHFGRHMKRMWICTWIVRTGHEMLISQRSQFLYVDRSFSLFANTVVLRCSSLEVCICDSSSVKQCSADPDCGQKPRTLRPHRSHETDPPRGNKLHLSALGSAGRAQPKQRARSAPSSICSAQNPDILQCVPRCDKENLCVPARSTELFQFSLCARALRAGIYRVCNTSESCVIIDGLFDHKLQVN